MFVEYGDAFSLDEAIRNAVGKAPGANALANAKASTTLLPLFIYNEMCHRVTGTAFRAQGRAHGPPLHTGTSL